MQVIAPYYFLFCVKLQLQSRRLCHRQVLSSTVKSLLSFPTYKLYIQPVSFLGISQRLPGQRKRPYSSQQSKHHGHKNVSRSQGGQQIGTHGHLYTQQVVMQERNLELRELSFIFLPLVRTTCHFLCVLQTILKR